MRILLTIKDALNGKIHVTVSHLLVIFVAGFSSARVLQQVNWDKPLSAYLTIFIFYLFYALLIWLSLKKRPA